MTLKENLTSIEIHNTNISIYMKIVNLVTCKSSRIFLVLSSGHGHGHEVATNIEIFVAITRLYKSTA